MAKKLNFSLRSDTGAAFPDVSVRLEILPSKELRFLRTDDKGQIVSTLPNGAESCRLEFGPIPGHWCIGEDVRFRDGAMRVWRATTLPKAAESFGWWHRTIGLQKTDPMLGQGIRIGVIDSGCSSHPALAHVDPVGTFISGQLPQLGIDDEVEHGTHICGIIGARTGNGTEYVGIAPAADLLVARVETSATGPAKQVDIANALDAMVARGVNLVNISLGARMPSQVLIDSIINAWLNGVVCFAAAGNAGGAVLWPAHHENVVAVTALGRSSEVPPGSLGALFLADSEQTDDSFDLTFAEFCSRGPQVRCCAPGVGIISTIGTPSGGSWADMSGTSMACPVALSTLACVLGRDERYAEAEPDEQRSQMVIEVLNDHLFPLSLDPNVQGYGLIVLDLASMAG